MYHPRHMYQHIIGTNTLNVLAIYMFHNTMHTLLQYMPAFDKYNKKENKVFIPKKTKKINDKTLLWSKGTFRQVLKMFKKCFVHARAIWGSFVYFVIVNVQANIASEKLR